MTEQLPPTHDTLNAVAIENSFSKALHLYDAPNQNKSDGQFQGRKKNPFCSALYKLELNTEP